MSTPTACSLQCLTPACGRMARVRGVCWRCRSQQKASGVPEAELVAVGRLRAVNHKLHSERLYRAMNAKRGK